MPNSVSASAIPIRTVPKSMPAIRTLSVAMTRFVLGGFNRLPTFRGFKVPVLEESHCIFVHALVVHEKAVQHRQDAKISCARQSRAFDSHDAVIVAWQQRIESLAISLSACQHAELKVRRGQLRFQLFPSSRHRLGSPAGPQITPGSPNPNFRQL